MLQTNEGGGDQSIWYPPQHYIDEANITQFINKHNLASLADLQQQALEDPEWFYPAVLEQLAFKWQTPFQHVKDTTQGTPWTKWFTEGETNIVLSAIEQHAIRNGDHVALTWEGEDGSRASKTYEQLWDEINELAAGLKELGITKGETVGLYLSPIPEVQTAFFACAQIGAVVVPIFSGYEADAIATRLHDCEAKLLITAEGSYRKGKWLDMKTVADRAIQQTPAIERSIMVTRSEEGPQDSFYVNYQHLLQRHRGARPATTLMKTDDPLLILYTSGTTGKPKGTVHSHTTFPVKAALDMFFCFDVKKHDRVFWMTDFGWMMGPWLLLGTALHGASLAMFEGSPDYPDCQRLWQFVSHHQVTVFGVAPTLIRLFMQDQQGEPAEADVVSLRILGSTGEAWNEEAWWWYLQKVGKNRRPIINYSGGTEVSGGILGTFPTHPLKSTAFHGPIPGMDARVMEHSGYEVHDEQGDLAIGQPFLGATLTFWKDSQRYLDTYWNTWTDLWHHGDLVKVDADGYWYILGRSDDTLKVAGKRIGPSEIEAALLKHPSVSQAAVIGVPHAIKGEVPVAFITLRSMITGADIRDHARKRLGKSLQPKEIVPVSDLPRTQSGKIARRIIRKAYLNDDLGDISTLQNPSVLKEMRQTIISSF
ncbi:AMP-binding protein [Thalassobacillus sp. CUG 92003]|uniref:AMP-binding protein n=1 Tax=Thalassobacillus sp. CUG 92003 TaxID=2736641 RepID=UPI0015E7DB09